MLWGYSLGSGPTIELASRIQNLAGIILQAPLASVLFWLDESANIDFCCKENDIYNNINKIENVKCKIFMIHGKEDITINARHSYFLYEKYVKAKTSNNKIWLIIAEGVGHCDLHLLLMDEKLTFCEKLRSFLSYLGRKECKLKNYFSPLNHEREFFLEKENKALGLVYKNIKIM